MDSSWIAEKGGWEELLDDVDGELGDLYLNTFLPPTEEVIRDGEIDIPPGVLAEFAMVVRAVRDHKPAPFDPQKQNEAEQEFNERMVEKYGDDFYDKWTPEEQEEYSQIRMQDEAFQPGGEAYQSREAMEEFLRKQREQQDIEDDKATWGKPGAVPARGYLTPEERKGEEWKGEEFWGGPPAGSLNDEYEADPTIKDKIVSFLEVALYEYDVHPEQFAEEIYSQLEAEDAIRGLMESAFPQTKGNHDEFLDEFNEILVGVLREMEGLLGGRSEFEPPRSDTGFRRMAIRQLQDTSTAYSDRQRMLEDPTISAERRAEIQDLVDQQIAEQIQKLKEQQRRQEEEGEEGGWWGTTPGERRAARLATPSTDVSERLLSQDVTAAVYDEDRNVTFDERVFVPGAERRVQQNADGETKRLLDQGLIAENEGAVFMSPEEIVTHNLLHNHWYRRAIESGDIEDMKMFRRVVEAVRAVRSAWGAAGRQMHDPTGGRMPGNYIAPANPLIRGAVLHEAMIEGSDAWRRKMGKARKKLKQAGERDDKNLERRARRRIQKLETNWEKRYGQLIRFLKRQGVDVDNLDVLARDAILSQKVLNKIAAHGATFTDARFEYYRNALLSALTTTGADVIGTSSFSIWKVGLSRGIEAFANSVRSAVPGLEMNTDEATWAEFKDIALGMKHGVGRAFSNMWTAMITEKPQLQRFLDADNQTGKFDNLKVAIKNRVIGRAVRGMGYTRLLMADEFFQTLGVYMEVGAQARRMALAAGLESGSKEMSDYITAAQKDQRHGAWQKALEIARRVTFQSKGGPAREGMKAAGKAISREMGAISDHFTRFQMPFLGTPVNIIAESLQFSPVGIFGLAADWVARSKTEDGVPYATERLAVQVLNWAALMFVLYSNDDDEPWITGSNDHIGMNAQRTARRTIPARSVRIPWGVDEEGNALYAPYDRIEPWSLGMAMTTDIANAVRRGDTMLDKWLGGLSAPIPSTADTIANKAYLQTLGELQKMATRPEGGGEGIMREAVKYFARRTAGYVPNIMRHAVKHIGKVKPERRVWGLTTEEFAMRVMDRTIQGMDIFPYLKPDHERFDAWGHPVRKAAEIPPMGTWVTRMAFPGQVQRERWEIGDKIITHWNEQNPFDEKNFAYIEDRYVDPTSGKERGLSDPQMEEAQFTQGTISRHMMDLAAEHLLPEDIRNPSEDVLKIVTQSRSTGNTLGRQLLIAKWHKGLKSMPNLEEAARKRYQEQIVTHANVLGRRGPPSAYTSEARRKYGSREEWAEAVKRYEKNLETSRVWLQSRRIPVRTIERAIPRRGTVLRRRLSEYSQSL